MHLDIHTGVQTALVLTILAILISLVSGYRSIRKGSALKFFRMRRDRMLAGYRMIVFALALCLVAFFLFRFAEPMIYRVYPPTATLTPTATLNAGSHHYADAYHYSYSYHHIDPV